MTTTTATAGEPIVVTAGTWKIDPVHSQVGFAVRHLMIATVRGRFGGVQGTVRTEEGDPTAASVEVAIDAASIDTREEQRDAHLRSADFFDAASHPTLNYRSRRIDTRPEGTLRVIGDLTIRGITREVALNVTPDGQGRDPWGGERMAFSAAATINRRDFGLTWNQALEAGGVVVGDEVKIAIEVELVKAA